MLQTAELQTKQQNESAAMHQAGLLIYSRQFLGDALALLRPKQWVKNVFVLTPLLFSGLFVEVNAVAAVCLAVVCFCLWSSAVYCVNDVLDANADRSHLRKRMRPVASRRISASVALVLATALVCAGGAIAVSFSSRFIYFGLLYLGNSALYCVLLKRRVIVDVISIAIGFVVRLLGGCWAIGVQPSPWIIICGFSLTLMLGFGKRRLENSYQELGIEYRKTLESYSIEKLNMLLGVTTAVCLRAYMLYTVSPDTVRLHGNYLIYTIPFVAYGMFRYLFKVQEGKGDGPVEILLWDPIFALNGLLWVSSVVVICYLHRSFA